MIGVFIVPLSTLSDLVTRLRAKSRVWRDRNSTETAALLDEAANEIEEYAGAAEALVALVAAAEIADGVPAELAGDVVAGSPHCGCYYRGGRCCFCYEVPPAVGIATPCGKGRES